MGFRWSENMGRLSPIFAGVSELLFPCMFLYSL